MVDQAGIIDAGIEQQMEAWLAELAQKTTAQVKVLTVTSTEGEEPFDWGHRHAELWGLGQKGTDQGALIALALEERNVFIHTGYGVEAVLPDLWCAKLSRQVRDRYFKEGDYSTGLATMAAAVANRVAGATNVKLSGTPTLRRRQGA